MRRVTALLMLLPLICGCAAEPARTVPAIATPGPQQETLIQGLFRGEGEPEEVIELDAEHGYWAYRSDTLGMAIEAYERAYDAGTAACCCAEIAWRGVDPLRTGALTERSILLVPETERLTLIEGGLTVLQDARRVQRAGYGRLPDGGYVVIALGGRFEGEAIGLDAEEFAELFLEAGCDWAVQLAEGPDAQILFMGTCLNDPIRGEAATPVSGVGWGERAE